TATPAPTQAPTPTPAPIDANWPDQIEASKLADYGFAVEAKTETTYQYSGWQTIDGKQYYYDPVTHQPVTGTQVIDGNVYTFSASGVLGQKERGIDVSKFQGTIDWNAVKADGITFAIIRCGYRGYGSGALVEDSTFRRNIQGATAAGIKVGVYFYSQAINEAEAVEEASMVLSLVQGYSLPYGVYYDTEKVAGDTGRADTISAAQRTACAVAFCETIRNAGYSAGVYSYASWFYNSLNFANVSKYRIWIAQYRDTLDFAYSYNIWQYTSTGKVSGIKGNVDMNLG
ncbi:glycosyl hydrolase family 25, partial [Gemmiger formicilis]|uniref:glycoside hydrolase family 25 protein n=1 Tax=Gemmiger formicilis TaxID=745368 RepID=UPI001957F643